MSFNYHPSIHWPNHHRMLRFYHFLRSKINFLFLIRHRLQILHLFSSYIVHLTGTFQVRLNASVLKLLWYLSIFLSLPVLSFIDPTTFLNCKLVHLRSCFLCCIGLYIKLFKLIYFSIIILQFCLLLLCRLRQQLPFFSLQTSSLSSKPSCKWYISNQLQSLLNFNISSATASTPDTFPYCRFAIAL